MELNKETIDTIRKDLKEYIPQLSINCVIFRFYKKRLQVPVVQPLKTDIWVLPGGFIRQMEGINDAAKRILFEQTQIDSLILSQFGTFGSSDRNFALEYKSLKNWGFPQDLLDWVSQRFVTIGYYSIVGAKHMELKGGPLFKNVKWIDVEETEILAIDHARIVSEALKVLGTQLLSRPLLLSFMAETFTIPELQKLYEAILGRVVDRGNFRQRILKSEILIKIGTSKEKTKNRPPNIYRLNKDKYLNSLTQDVKLGF